MCSPAGFQRTHFWRSDEQRRVKLEDIHKYAFCVDGVKCCYHRHFTPSHISSLSPFSLPPQNSFEDSACVLDFPLNLHNPAQPFLSHHRAQACHDLSHKTEIFLCTRSCSLLLSPNSVTWRLQASLGLTLSPLLPPHYWRAGGRTGQDSRCGLPAPASRTLTLMHTWA